MAELFTSPTTGQQRMLEYRESPAGVESINPQAIQRLFETQKIRDAEKAVAAAIQFQGIRGYQQALKSGEPAEKAMARYGPMMFYTRPSALGSAVRALTPPQLTPHQKFLQEQAKLPRVVQTPGGGFAAISGTNVTDIRKGKEAGRPEKFSAVVGTDRLRGDMRLPMTPDQFRTFMEQAPPKLKTNAVNTVISRIIAPPATLAATNAPAVTSIAPTKKRLRYNPKTGEFE